MLSYRHGYHAGNHADVLKHTVLLQCIAYMARKETPFWVIDTHAGAGGYALDSHYAQKNHEHRSGIERIDRASTLHSAALIRYRDVVRTFNPVLDNQTHALRYYPGSPQLAMALLRRQDKLKLFELHSSEAPALRSTMAPDRRRVQVINGDGLSGLKALLPPVPRRALTLIDPAYELADEYNAVAVALQNAIKRFASGVYAVWYPVLQKPAAQNLVTRLCDSIRLPWLSVQLHVCAVDRGGMTGSGLFLVNPPYTLKQDLEEALPEMVHLLGTDDSARYSLLVNYT
jgi:23S rRNA (adenine2030-N6)-methyltransferase